MTDQFTPGQARDAYIADGFTSQQAFILVAIASGAKSVTITNEGSGYGDEDIIGAVNMAMADARGMVAEALVDALAAYLSREDVERIVGKAFGGK